MAGDRRATMGNLIASRDIEKVHAADAYSLVGIAGTAGIGIELMRLFQVELEHYEKIEGTMLSLDGKANRLATMVRNNLGAAMQGLAVVPLFAGFDLDASRSGKAGRIFSFDVAGGLYEETGYDAIGSGSLFAKSALKKRYRPGLSTARGGPAGGRGALRRGRRRHRDRRPRPASARSIPVVMTATAEGTHRLTDDETARGRRGDRRRAQPRTRAAEPVALTPAPDDAKENRRRGHAVLRLARADHAGPLGVRPQGHRPRSQRRRAQLRGRRAVRRREPVDRPAQGQRDLRPDRLRRGRPLQRVREPALGRGADGRPARLLLRPARRHRPALANAYAQTLGAIFTEEQKPFEVEICVAEVGATAEDDELYRITYDGSVQDEPGFVAMGGQAEAISGVL